MNAFYWIVAALLAYLALGQYVTAPFRSARRGPAPQLEHMGADQRADIGPALRGSR